MSHLKAVSSCNGKIKHILLVFWEYLLEPLGLEDVAEDKVLKKIECSALRYYRPIIHALQTHAHEKEIFFDILIEHKVRICDHRSFNPRVGGGGIMPELSLAWTTKFLNPIGSQDIDPDFDCDCNETKHHEHHFPVGLGAQRFKLRNGSLVRFVYTNVDFDAVAREAMRAFDFESEFITIGNIKQLLQSIQDPFLPLGIGDEVVILEPFFSWPTVKGFPSPFNFKYIPEVLSSQTDIMLRSFPFYFQGGNVLIGNDVVLMGGDVAIKNLEAFEIFDEGGKKPNSKHGNPRGKRKEGQLSLADFKSLFAGLMGLRNAIVIGELDSSSRSKVPFIKPSSISENPEELFHLDTFLTLGGTYEGKQLAFLGQLQIWSVQGWVEVTKTNSKLIEDNHRLRFLLDYLDEVRTQLCDNCFHVEPLPLLFHNGCFYSYNNCLVEIYRDGLGGFETKRIYLPQFQFDAVDDYIKDSKPNFCAADKLACDAVRKFDFDPVLVDMHFRSFAHSRVGLHCMVSVLARYPDSGIGAIIQRVIHPES